MPSVITKEKHVIENPFSDEIKTWNNGGSGLLVGLKLVEIFQSMSKWDYDEKFIRLTKGVIKNSYPRAIVVSKIRGLKISKVLLNNFYKLFKEFPSFWFVDFWFLILPSQIYRLVASILKSLKYGA